MNISVLSLNESINIINEICPSKIIFWVGAGLDMNEPTLLPTGDEIVDVVSSLAVDRSFTDLMNEWKSNLTYLTKKDMTNLACDRQTRIHFIKDVLRFFDSQKTRPVSSIAGMKSFSADFIPSNIGHYTLAKYLHLGSSIVTTNYGNFIASAHGELFGEEHIYHKKSDLNICTFKNEWAGCIYHLHGVSENLYDEWTYYYTLDTIRELPDFFKNIYLEWLQNGCCVVYIGYSGADDDVNLLINSAKLSKCATGIYVQHSTEVSINESLPQANEQKILLPFDRKIVARCETNDLIRLLKFSPTTIPSNPPSTSWKYVFENYATKNATVASNTFWIPCFYSKINRYLKTLYCAS